MPLAHVLSPIVIKDLEIRNRVVRTAHGTSLGHGDVSDDLIAYHEARARGGVGLSMLEASSVHWSGPMTLHAWDDSVIPRYRLLMSRLRPHGMRLFLQINHMGAHGSPPWQRPWSASELPVPGSQMLSRAVSEEQIRELVEAFARAAQRAREGGLDGVEVHAAHGYLIQQFISPAWNRREDRYGGSFENRMRFYLEVLRAVRAAVGGDFVVGTRVGPHDHPGGLNVAEHVEIVRRVLAENVVDYLNVSHGSALNSHKIIGAMHEDTGYELPSSVPVTRLTELPTIVTGRFLTLEDADRVIAAGDADLVGMTRAHIADADLVRKTVGGRSQEIRPCIGCNQGCVGGLGRGRLGCAVNPAVGNERRLDEASLVRVSVPRRILVAGGGPAGLAAARMAALRGHRVTLVEARDRLGGRVNAARLAPRHASIGRITDWLEAELSRLGVAVRLGAVVDAGSLMRDVPDVLVVATGAAEVVDGRTHAVPEHRPTGIDQPHVVSAEALLLRRHNLLGSTALVVDDVGGYEAIGAAEFLVEQGCHVTFVTPHPTFAPLMAPIGVARPAWERLSAGGRFRLITRGYLKRVGTGEALVASLDGWPDMAVAAEIVVPVGVGAADEGLPCAARAAGVPVMLAGDAAAPGFLPGAIESGERVGREV